MPIYAYRCAGCGHELDALQKISDAPLTECPACHQPLLTKKLTAAGFQLKGSGWYATDFRDKAGARKEGKAEAAGNGESRTEAKTDTKATGDGAAKPAESTPTPAPAAAPPPPSSTS
ncbi:MAG TPA: FmdB family zinc ribbon protein [Burkholderiaceae bacterium]|nr:FmdB family zinc ribbon protein [Burkholderiaceae bacterium]